MQVEVPGSDTGNPQEGIRIRQVKEAIRKPSKDVQDRMDKAHTKRDFGRDLERATERAREEESS